MHVVHTPVQFYCMSKTNFFAQVSGHDYTMWYKVAFLASMSFLYYQIDIPYAHT